MPLDFLLLVVFCLFCFVLVFCVFAKLFLLEKIFLKNAYNVHNVMKDI